VQPAVDEVQREQLAVLSLAPGDDADARLGQFAVLDRLLAVVA